MRRCPPDLAPRVGDPAGRDCERPHRRRRCGRRSSSTCAGRGLAVDDLGVDGSTPVDYPDIAARVAKPVARGEADAGIVIDGAGIGSAIAANKVRGVRAAMITDETIARYAREHNGTNVMTLGSTLLPTRRSPSASSISGSGPPMTEARYIRRLLKIRRLEEVRILTRTRMLNPNDLQRLVEIITEEVMTRAAPRRVARRRSAAATPCSTTAVRIGCAACSTPARRASASTRPAAPRARSPA